MLIKEKLKKHNMNVMEIYGAGSYTSHEADIFVEFINEFSVGVSK